MFIVVYYQGGVSSREFYSCPTILHRRCSLSSLLHSYETSLRVLLMRLSQIRSPPPLTESVIIVKCHFCIPLYSNFEISLCWTHLRYQDTGCVFHCCVGFIICPPIFWCSSHREVELNSPPSECGWTYWLTSNKQNGRTHGVWTWQFHLAL